MVKSYLIQKNIRSPEFHIPKTFGGLMSAGGARKLEPRIRCA